MLPPVFSTLEKLHQSTAASTWWCGPRPRLGWVETAVGLPEGPSYPGHSPSFFRYAAPWTTAEGQHKASTKSVACFHFFFSPALLLPFFVSSFFFFSWWAVTVIPTLAPSFLALCAMEMWPGGASQCNAAPTPNRSIWSAHNFPCPNSELLAALTLGASPPAVTLWLPPRTPPTYIPPLHNLAPLYWCCTHASPSSPNLLSSFCPVYISFPCPFTTVPCSWPSFLSSPWLSQGSSMECWRSPCQEHWTTSLSLIPSCRPYLHPGIQS